MFQRAHRTLYAAFDRFPSRKGAAIHIDRFARTLFDTFDGGVLLVLGAGDLAAHQVEGPVEIARFPRATLRLSGTRSLFGDWITRALDRLEDSLEICHFRDPWSGAPIALRPRRKYAAGARDSHSARASASRRGAR